MSMFRTLITSLNGGGSILPPEYQQVEYIEGTGTQYINTNFYDAGKTDYELNFELTTIAHNYQMLLAAKKKYQSFPKLFSNQDDITTLRLDTSSTNTITNVSAYTKYKLEVIGNKAYLDGVEKLSFTRGYNTGQYPIWIFNAPEEPTLIAAMKLYHLILYDDSVAVRNFIPCYRKSDNEIGLYDTVNDVFYTNAGTGTFLKGSDV